MAQEYTIAVVSSKPPKEWQSSFGPMYTYNIMLEGRSQACEINKKPESPAPKKGDVLYGHIESTSYGDKFKSEQRPQGRGQTGGQDTSWKPRDDSAIQAQFAIKAAIAYHAGSDTVDKTTIEDSARDFFLMIDRVKAGTSEQEEPLPDFPGEDQEEPYLEPGGTPF